MGPIIRTKDRMVLPNEFLFEFDTASHGRLAIRRPKMREIIRVAADFRRAHGTDHGSRADTLVELMVVALGRCSDGSELTLEDARQLNEQERTGFAELFLEKSALASGRKTLTRGVDENAKLFSRVPLLSGSRIWWTGSGARRGLLIRSMDQHKRGLLIRSLAAS
jgi:hypothetical protein